MYDFWCESRVSCCRPNCPSSATDNCIDEAQLLLCYFAPLPKLCGQKSNLPSCVAQKAAMICFQKFNSPRCVVRKLAMISGRKSNHLTAPNSTLAPEVIHTYLRYSLVISSQKALKRKLTTYHFQMSTLSKRFLALERNLQHMVWRCKLSVQILLEFTFSYKSVNSSSILYFV